MSGRVFDLITAENFAKWAEERGELWQTTGLKQGIGRGCAGAQFLQSLGFQHPVVSCISYACDVPPGTDWREAARVELQRWFYAVVSAWDKGQRSGPALAKIARENA